MALRHVFYSAVALNVCSTIQSFIHLLSKYYAPDLGLVLGCKVAKTDSVSTLKHMVQ